MSVLLRGNNTGAHSEYNYDLNYVGRLIRKGGKLVRDRVRAQKCCECTPPDPTCTFCTTLFQADDPVSPREKEFYDIDLVPQYVFQDYRSVNDHWGPYEPPELDEITGLPIEGTGNPPWHPDHRTKFKMRTCSRFLVSPFIEGPFNAQTGTFNPEYKLKTNNCGFKPYFDCACFGANKRPFALDYDNQQGTLLDTFPYWLGPATTNDDCPVESSDGAWKVLSGSIPCPETLEFDPENCCRVGGYAIDGSFGSPLPEWDWIKSREWWPSPSDARLALVVSYMSYQEWTKSHSEPHVWTLISSQDIIDSGARITGAFITTHP